MEGFSPLWEARRRRWIITVDDITPAIPKPAAYCSADPSQCSIHAEILKPQSAALLEVQELESTSIVFLHELVRDMIRHDLKQRNIELTFFEVRRGALL